MENTIQSDLIRGHINTIILKALFDGDRYGYDIVREIEQKSSGQYKLKQPTLYSCLKRLEIQGFIRSYWGAKSNGGRRKYFTLTDLGRELFIKNQSEWEYSRTVIDKLISDKEVDLNNLSSSYTPMENEVISESEIEEDAEYLSEENESTESIETSDTVAYDTTAESNTNTETAAEEAVAATTTETDSRQAEQQPIVFSDTTAIMNELFRQKTETDASYTEKLISEKYVADHATDAVVSSDSYFRDFYEEPEPKLPSEESQDNVSPQTQETLEEQPPVYETPSAPSPANTFLNYHTATVAPRPENAIIEREYRNILGDFLNSSFVARAPAPPPPQQYASPPAEEEPPAEDTYEAAAPDDLSEEEYVSEEEYASEEEQMATYTDDAEVNRKLNNLAGEVRDMGDNVVIRTHSNESAKEYTNTYYYYSNKLMLVHYALLFGIMMLEILFTAAFVNLVLHAGRSSDKWFYIVAVVIAVAFPLVAFIKNFNDPNKRKRINFNLKNSLIYRSIVMAQCLLIIYCVNIIAKMPLGFSMDYITTLLLPALLCTGFPVSALIFNALFKSKRFSID